MKHQHALSTLFFALAMATGCGSSDSSETGQIGSSPNAENQSSEARVNQGFQGTPAKEPNDDRTHSLGAPSQPGPNQSARSPERSSNASPQAGDASDSATHLETPPSAGQAAPAETGDDEGRDPEPQAEPQETWIQLSTDDSTSMASAQLYKSGASRFQLKAHEFLNYYDPPARLFEAENWTQQAEVNDAIEFGIKAVFLPLEDMSDEPMAMPVEPELGDEEATDEGDEDQMGPRERPVQDEPEDAPVIQRQIAGHAEVLFQLRSDTIAHQTRRNWNLFLCVDVSGSMRGEKMDFTRQALVTMLDHLKAGDRLTLVTFDSEAHDVFVDLEFSENRADIVRAFEGLRPGSSTNMIAGLKRTYEYAQNNFNNDMLQRVILFGDGQANVGRTDIDAFAELTRINGQEGIYLSGVGVGSNYDAQRMDELTDAGKGAHVFLPNAEEVSLIFGDYFPKLVEVAADEIAIEMTLPAGIHLEQFSGEEVSTNREQRLQNIVLAAGDDMTFIAQFMVDNEADLDKPASLRVTLRPLSTGQEVVHHLELDRFRDLLGDAGPLFQRTRIINQFGQMAATGAGEAEALVEKIQEFEQLDWGLEEILNLVQR